MGLLGEFVLLFLVFLIDLLDLSVELTVLFLEDIKFRLLLGPMVDLLLKGGKYKVLGHLIHQLLGHPA